MADGILAGSTWSFYGRATPTGSMRPRVRDGIVLIYNYAVVLSGWVLVTRFGISDQNALLGFSVVIALGWTLYFRFGMESRLADLSESADEG